MIVQNTENMGVREGRTSVNWGFYDPKKHLYGCDRSSWVYARWHCDDITDTVVTFTQRFRGLVMNNIICDFIPVLEIKGGCEQDDDKHMVAEMLIPVV